MNSVSEAATVRSQAAEVDAAEAEGTQTEQERTEETVKVLVMVASSPLLEPEN
jgi:hypothetical protein